jgi:hypothetical protein
LLDKGCATVLGLRRLRPPHLVDADFVHGRRDHFVHGHTEAFAMFGLA